MTNGKHELKKVKKSYIITLYCTEIRRNTFNEVTETQIKKVLYKGLFINNLILHYFL